MTLFTREYLSDGAMFLSLLCLWLDTLERWHGLDVCQRPIHAWMAVSYCLVICSRILHIIGTMASPSGGAEFLLDLRPHGLKMQFLTFWTWLVILPLQAVWALCGSAVLVRWLIQSSQQNTLSCTSGSSVWVTFVVLWHCLNYLWVVMHARVAFMACRHELHARGLEAQLRLVETPDMIARWGSASSSEVHSISTSADGLSAAQIASLENREVLGSSMQADACSICIEGFHVGDSIRRLACGHAFHISCIDLWLVRQASCPLCKQKVIPCGGICRKTQTVCVR